MALQNLARRPARAALLAAAVAVGVGTLFAARTLGRAVEASMAQGFARMGADLLVVPAETLVNLTPALLTVEPTPHTLDATAADELARAAGVEWVAPQRYYQIPVTGQGHVHDADLVGFDPNRDFTVLPWLQEHQDRPFGEGDVLVGGRRDEVVGSALTLEGRTLTVYGRLGRTGVGPFDRALFVSFATAGQLRPPEPGGVRYSALLVRLTVGSRPEQVRFALAGRSDLRVVAGNPLFTSVRLTLAAVFQGVAVFTLLMLLGTALMVGSLYSAVLTERRHELGLLLALGMRGRQLTRWIIAEAALTTGLGGFCGVLVGAALLLLVRRSLVYYFEWVDVPFLWPGPARMAFDAGAAVLLASAIGTLGAFVPARRAARQEPFDLIHAGGG